MSYQKQDTQEGVLVVISLYSPGLGLSPHNILVKSYWQTVTIHHLLYFFIHSCGVSPIKSNHTSATPPPKCLIALENQGYEEARTIPSLTKQVKNIHPSEVHHRPKEPPNT